MAASQQLLTSVVAAPNVRAVVSWPLQGDSEQSQTLVFCDFGVCPLIVEELGANDDSTAGRGLGARLGPPLALRGAAAEYAKDFRHAAYDLHSDKVIIAIDRAVLLLDRNHTISILVGNPASSDEPRDGARGVVRCKRVQLVTTGPSGLLYYTDYYGKYYQLQELQLNGSACTVVRVPTVHHVTALAYSRLNNELLYVSSDQQNLIKRVLPFNDVEVLAGSTGGTTVSTGPTPAAQARFQRIQDIAADDAGNLFILDDGALRVLQPDGMVNTLTLSVYKSGYPCDRLAALPGGLLALWGGQPPTRNMLLVQLGGKQDATGVHASRAIRCPGFQEPLSSLAADLGALLEVQPDKDSTADVTLTACGGRPFPAHLAILSARCPYFRTLFKSGFADSGAREVQLPDADPDALAAVLRYLYTGGPGDLPQALLRPVAELADRLLLPDLCARTQAALLRSVTPSTVVSDMLWAERAGAGMEGLLRRLEGYFAVHRAKVAAQAPDSLEQLTTGGSPLLLKRLLMRGVNMP